MLSIVAVVAAVAAGQPDQTPPAPKAAPKPPDPTPTLSALPANVRAVITKRARNVYRMPDGRLADLDLSATIMDAYGKSIITRTRYRSSSQGGVKVNIPEGTETVVEPTAEYERCMELAQVAPWARIWKDGKEVELTHQQVAAGRSAALVRLPGVRLSGDLQPDSLNMVFRWPSDKHFSNKSWRVVATSTPNVTQLDISEPGEMNRFIAPSTRFHSYYLQTDATITFRQDDILVSPDRKPVEEFFLLPSTESAMVNGKTMGLCTLLPASKARLTPEQLAKAVVDGEMSLVEWIKTGTTWQSKTVEVKPKKL
jgi:hypothetical protein